VSPFANPWLTNRLIRFAFSQTGRAHLLLVSLTPGEEGGGIGVVTLEGQSGSIPVTCFPTHNLPHPDSDIIEVSCTLFWGLGIFLTIPQEMISEEIVDETDRYSDNHHKIAAPRDATDLTMSK
jgi:metal transporter CNNM